MWCRVLRKFFHNLSSICAGLLVVSLAVLLASCEDDVPDLEIAQFNRPQNVALVCYDMQSGPLPIDSCANTQRTDAQLYAFVTQTELGEVALVSLEDYSIVDQEQRLADHFIIQIPFDRGVNDANVVFASSSTRVVTSTL